MLQFTNYELTSRMLPKTVALIVMMISIIAFFVCGQQSQASVGPNMLANSSFENIYGWSLPSQFVIKTDGANAHTGVGYLQGNLTGSYTSVWNEAAVWPNTSYTFTIYYKGSGIASIYVVAGSTYNVSLGGSGLFSASSSWQAITFTINTGSYNNIGIGIQDDGAGTMYLDDFTMGVTNFNSIAFNPSNPSAYGMSFIFDDEFNNGNTIDVNATGNDGYHWYPQQFFGYSSATSSSYAINGSYLGASGVLSFDNSPDNFSSTIETAHPASNSSGYLGTTFNGGQGIYFEAKIADANLSVLPQSGNDPCFWMQDVKLLTGLNTAMPGWPGHTEEVENDIMEYNPNWSNGSPSTSYNSAMGDWNDSSSSAIVNYNHVVYMPAADVVTNWHTYGELWVPGTAANGWDGYRIAYLDGVPQQAVCWIGNQISPTWPASGSYLFSLTDQDWYPLILGSDQGGTPTMYVDYVHVYAVNPTASMKVLLSTGSLGTPPPAATGLTAATGSGQISLSWSGSSGASTYNVYRGTSPGGESVTPVKSGLALTGYTDTSVLSGTTYYYRVAAVNGFGVSPQSNEATAGSSTVANSGFESGTTSWNWGNVFTLGSSSSNAHSGSHEAVATLTASASGTGLYQACPVSANTNYSESIWVKGAGNLMLFAYGSSWSTLSCVSISATSTWQLVRVPTFNTGSSTTVYFEVSDNLGGKAGIVYIDDATLAP